MKTISAAMKTLLQSNLSTLAICMRIERPDGVEAFFTGHDADLEISGDTYESQLGFDSSAFNASSTLKVDAVDTDVFFDTNQISEVDVYARKWDYSTVDIFYVDWTNPSGTPFYILKAWRLGEFEISDQGGRVEVRGKMELLKQKILDLYSVDCRVDLGSAACGVDLDNSLGDFVHTGSVTAVDTSNDQRIFFDSTIPEATNVYRFGKLTWSDFGSSADSELGLNAGLEMEVKTYDPVTKEVELFQAMPFDIQIGDRFTMTYGCDKSIATCSQVFSNVVNFRGFPFIPGTDKVYDVVPGRKSTLSGGGKK